MANQQVFLDRFAEFIKCLPREYIYCVETRNPNYLNSRYFDFLAEHDLHHVFLQGYYMPPIFDVYRMHRGQIADLTVIRLHGPDRKAIEEQTGKDWSQVVLPKDREIEQLAGMLADLASRDVQSYIYVNNHFEGSAPRTISRIQESLDR